MIEPRAIDLLIEGGVVVTVDAARRVIADGTVAVEGGGIGGGGEGGVVTAVVGGGRGGLQIREGSLHNGFEFPEARLLVYNEEEIFGPVRRPAAASKGRATFHSDFRDLRNGDLVVHAEHGIGRFLGLEMLAGTGQGEGEFLVLEYREGDRLFVPIVRLDLLQRYSGSGGSVPRLDRLGGKSWEKTRSKVKGAMREMAGELLKLYAARKADKGHAFPSDTPWQKELEDAFPFEETPDQERTIMEVKGDMEREETLRDADIVSKCRWTPFDGWSVKGAPVLTLVRGNVVRENGEVTAEAGLGEPVKKVDP